MSNINFQSIQKTLLGLNGIPETVNTKKVDNFTEVLSNATNQKVANALHLQGLAVLGENAIHMRVGNNEQFGQLTHVASGYNIWAMAGNAGSYLEAGSGNDWLIGGNGKDAMWGNDGNDYLHGGAGADSLNGGNGDDVLVGGAGLDTLTGGAGADTFVLGTQSSSKTDVIKDFSFAEGDKIEIIGKFDKSAIDFKRDGKDNGVLILVDGKAVGKVKIEDEPAGITWAKLKNDLLAKIAVTESNPYSL